MKSDVLVVPNDTIVMGVGDRTPRGPMALEDRLPEGFFWRMARTAYLSAHCSEGPEAYAQGCDKCPRHNACDGEAVAGPKGAAASQVPLRVLAHLLATGIGGRIEPLYPSPDDLLVEPGARDAVWAQPTYLEAVPGDVARSDRGEMRLLTPSTRNTGATAFSAYLTRKGLRIWSERKPQRLGEGEHYMPLRRLMDFEVRMERGPQHGMMAPRVAVTHMRLKPGIGFLLTIETPEGRPGLNLPVTVAVGYGRTIRMEQVRYPLPSFDNKPKKRWRLYNTATIEAADGGWPSWIDASDLTTREPLPPQGKVTAVARRSSEQFVDGTLPVGASAQPRTIIPVGTTYFIEFNEPVRVEPSAEFLAGGS